MYVRTFVDKKRATCSPLGDWSLINIGIELCARHSAQKQMEIFKCQYLWLDTSAVSLRLVVRIDVTYRTRVYPAFTFYDFFFFFFSSSVFLPCCTRERSILFLFRCHALVVFTSVDTSNHVSVCSKWDLISSRKRGRGRGGAGWGAESESKRSVCDNIFIPMKWNSYVFEDFWKNTL